MPDRDPIRITHHPESLGDATFEALREAIIAGQLQPGEWLRQEALAKELEVSQITVRDALNRLVGEGLAVRIPYKGVRVVVLSPADLKDIYEMRQLLEGLAAEVAATQITADELEELRELLPETVVDADSESVLRAREANREFHEIVTRASRRRFLIRVLSQIWNWHDPMMLYGRTQHTDEGREVRLKWGDRDRIQHTRLLEALEAGDGAAARQVVHDYVAEAWHNLQSVIADERAANVSSTETS
jgi:DNA-binding GntR family transcriptional regulator